ncbi:MAG: hypothetical protein NT014_07715, partial [Candidatus Omnitrophica bacterium]|nr:hypothetical protein [Candidatus Omnitrophota bacterium]
MKTKKMKFKQTEVINFCDKAIIFSLYGVAFFLPISKAIIEVFIYISIAAFLLKKLLAKEDVVRSPINIPVTAYFFISFFSIFFSSNPGISSSSFLGKILQNIAFFFVVVDVLNSERRLKNIIYILFCSSLLLGIDGIFQYFTHRDFLRLRKDLMIPRIYASFGTPNDFACYLITVIPFIISLFFLKTNSRKYRLFTGGLFLLLFICLLLTVSRGAWFAFLGLILFISLWIPQLWVLIFSIAVFIAVTIVFFPPYV